jgi:hypothetical protein
MAKYSIQGRRLDGDSSVESKREQGLEALTRAFSADFLSMDEYEKRAGLVQNARDYAEIDAVLADLPREAPHDFPARPAPSGPDKASPRDGLRGDVRIDTTLSGSQTVACVMGDRQLQGDWLTGDRVDSFTLMGSTKIDLRDVALPEGRLRIEAFVLMGETRIIVPRGLPVRLNAFPFMGEATARRDVNQRVVQGEPHVLIEGFVMMGSLVVIAQD